MRSQESLDWWISLDMDEKEMLALDYYDTKTNVLNLSTWDIYDLYQEFSATKKELDALTYAEILEAYKWWDELYHKDKQAYSTIVFGDEKFYWNLTDNQVRLCFIWSKHRITDGLPFTHHKPKTNLTIIK